MLLFRLGSVSYITWSHKWDMFVEGLVQHVMLHRGEKYQNILIPNYIQKIVLRFEHFPTTPEGMEIKNIL